MKKKIFTRKSMVISISLTIILVFLSLSYKQLFYKQDTEVVSSSLLGQGQMLYRN